MRYAPGTLHPLMAGGACIGLLCIPATAATPILAISSQGTDYDMVLGFAQDSGSANAGAVIKVYNGTPHSQPVDLTWRLSEQGEVRSVKLPPGSYSLVFEGFQANCEPRLFVELPGLEGAHPTISFTAESDAPNNRVRIAQLVMDHQSKHFFSVAKHAIHLKRPKVNLA